MDTDRRNALPSGGQDSVSSSVGAHAALLSAANAGSGYTAFALVLLYSKLLIIVCFPCLLCVCFFASFSPDFAAIKSKILIPKFFFPRVIM